MYFQENSDVFLDAVFQHLAISGIALVTALIIGVPFGILCYLQILKLYHFISSLEVTEVYYMESAEYKGTNKMIVGIVFGVITFWLFAQAVFNVVPAIKNDLGIPIETLNIGISLTALFSGMFIVAAGGLADQLGRKRITYIGLILSVIGSLCLVLSQGAVLLIIGRVIQGLSAACIMPATIALIKAYFEGADRQRALSYWSIGSWGGSGVASFA